MSFSYDRPKYRRFPTVTYENIFQWNRDVHSLYRNLARDIHAYGHQDLILTDVQWQALPGHQASTARPVRTLPNNPAGNASAADLALYNRLASNRSRSLGPANDAKEYLIQSIGEANVMKLRHPVTDMAGCHRITNCHSHDNKIFHIDVHYAGQMECFLAYSYQCIWKIFLQETRTFTII